MADESRWGEEPSRDWGDRDRRDRRRDWRADDYRDEPRRYGAGDYEGQRYAEDRFDEEPTGAAWPRYEERRDRPDFMSERRGAPGWSENDRREYARRREEEMRNERARGFSGWDAPFGGRPVHGRESASGGWDRPREESRNFLERTRDELASLFGVGRREDERTAGYRAEPRMEGEYRGRGPRGYRRSDERIREDVNDRLTEDPWLDASDIDVRVQGGEVTLDGRVRTRGDKRRAEDLVEQVLGVGHVQNNLRPDHGPTRYEDPSIS